MGNMVQSNSIGAAFVEAFEVFHVESLSGDRWHCRRSDRGGDLPWRNEESGNSR